MNKLLMIMTLATLLFASSCHKCYTCRDVRTESHNGIPYTARETIRICATDFRDNADFVSVRNFYEHDGFHCVSP